MSTMAFRPSPALAEENVDVRTLDDAIIKGDFPNLSAKLYTTSQLTSHLLS
jgi:hypothetical protein